MKFHAEPFAFTVLAVFGFVKYSLAIEADLTIDIEAGKRECFHQFVPTDSSFEVEYQVSVQFTPVKCTQKQESRRAYGTAVTGIVIHQNKMEPAR